MSEKWTIQFVLNDKIVHHITKNGFFPVPNRGDRIFLPSNIKEDYFEILNVYLDYRDCKLRC